MWHLGDDTLLLKKVSFVLGSFSFQTVTPYTITVPPSLSPVWRRIFCRSIALTLTGVSASGGWKYLLGPVFESSERISICVAEEDAGHYH